MAMPHPLSEPLVELIAERFRLVAEPMRIRILDQLRECERSVGELADVLGTTQQNVSKHLTALHRADVVHRRKDGNRAMYRIADRSVFALCEAVCGGLQAQLDERARILETASAGG